MQSFHRMSARITQGNRVEPTSLPLVIRLDARLSSRRYQLRRMLDVGYIPTLRPMDSPHFANSGPAGSVRDPPTGMVADRLSADVPTAREFATWLCAVVTSSFLRSNRASLRSLDGRSPGLRAVRRLSYTRAAVP